METAGQSNLYATTRLDGGISVWDIDGSNLTLAAELAYEAQAIVGGEPHLIAMEDALISGGGRRFGLVQHQLGSDRDITTSRDLNGTDTFEGRLGETSTILTDDGTTLVYGRICGRDEIGWMTFDARLSFLSSGTIDTDEIGTIASVDIAGSHYVFGATVETEGITAWRVTDDHGLETVDRLTVDDGLWISAPTALATTTQNGQTYLILASAGSHSLSVMSVGADGSLQIVDHLLDDRNSRFAGVTTVEATTIGDRSYIVAGGADDGISVYEILPGGQLLSQAHIADTTTMGLANISDIALRADATGIDIFASSSGETGITRLRFEVGTLGLMLVAKSSGGALSGTENADILVGGAGKDRITGGDGDDIFYDGAHADTMTGGNGNDTFVLSYDGSGDVITDFDPQFDRLDLSAWPSLRSLSQLTMSPTETGIRIEYGGEVLTLLSTDGKPIAIDALTETNLLGGNRLPQTIVSGFSGPIVTPDLPDRPEIEVDPTEEDETDIGRSIEGTSGSDLLTGDKFSDTVLGLSGSDTLYGMSGADHLDGNTGDDKLFGGNGADTLYGGGGRPSGFGGDVDNQDVLHGGPGNDQLYGQSGADRLDGEDGDDILTGGGGRDTFIFNDGYDLATDFDPAVDLLELDDNLWSGTLSATSVVNRFAQVEGNSVVFDFGSGDVLTLAGVDTTNGLAALIDIV